MNEKTNQKGLLLSLAWMTSNNHYSLKAAKKEKGNESALLLALFDLLEVLSKTPWEDLTKLTKYDTDKGGFEELPVQAMKLGILDEMPSDIAKQVESVLVFRFNKGQDRLIAYKMDNTLYLLGFDLHFKLYDHGN
ncbi:MAG: hypothetical protein K2H85_08660 [Allobaculum sp.]|nr:hypothetical protein [Allobaculum sp.]